jgi:hypothetical protein
MKQIHSPGQNDSTNTPTPYPPISTEMILIGQGNLPLSLPAYLHPVPGIP